MTAIADDGRAALEAIGQKGATLDRVAEVGLSRQVLGRLVGDGFLRVHRIELQETVGGAGRSPGLVDVYMLTDAGATAVGIDPWRIGLA